MLQSLQQRLLSMIILGRRCGFDKNHTDFLSLGELTAKMKHERKESSLGEPFKKRF